MDVLIVRHARAEDRRFFALSGKSDSQRPLTHEGRERMERGMPGLRRFVLALHGVATSPWLRAVQTADILASYYGLEPVLLDALEPPIDFDSVCRWLGQQTGGCVAVVGHEPDLGWLASHFLCGGEESFVPLKKGGACLIGFNGMPDAGRGELRWLLTPAQLRKMG